jgi:hypothetical protein
MIPQGCFALFGSLILFASAHLRELHQIGRKRTASVQMSIPVSSPDVPDMEQKIQH